MKRSMMDWLMLVSTVLAALVSVVALVFSVNAFNYDNAKSEPHLKIAGYAPLRGVGLKGFSGTESMMRFYLYVITNTGGADESLLDLWPRPTATSSVSELNRREVVTASGCVTPGPTKVSRGSTAVFILGTPIAEPQSVVAMTSSGQGILLPVTRSGAALQVAIEHLSIARQNLAQCQQFEVPSNNAELLDGKIGR